MSPRPREASQLGDSEVRRMALGLLGLSLPSGPVNLVSVTEKVSDLTSLDFFLPIYKKEQSPRVDVNTE